MASFDKYSNYNKETSFSSVVFGSEKPVLEVELNELQQILNDKIYKLVRGMGTKVLFLETPTVDTTNFKFTINSALVYEKTSGYMIEVKNANVTYSSTNRSIYLKIEEKDVDSATELYSYGNTNGGVITNPIKDSRFPIETSRRKCLVYTLVAGTTVPTSTDTIKYVGIATSNSSGVLTYSNYVNSESVVDSLLSINTTIDNIKSGTVTVGNATKLNNLSASSYCLASNYNYKTYYEVSQVSGLTSSTATPALVWSTLSSGSIFIVSSSTISASGWNFPDTSGTLTVIKVSGSSGFIHFQSKSNINKRYYMLLTSSGNPTGTWVSMIDGGNSATVNGFTIWTETNLTTPLADSSLPTTIVNQLPDKCIFYGCVTASENLPKWLPTAITTKSWMLTIVKHDTTRVKFSLDGMQDNSIHYVAGMNSGAWTGWNLLSNSVVATASIEDEVEV